jgi:hypothetical protein
MMTDLAGLDPLRDRLILFTQEIGIEVRNAALDDSCILPGLDIRGGAIVVDQPRWLHAGDILHEAGHLAVAAPEQRLAARFSPSGGDEMAAIAWSYAAALHLDLETAIVFHAAGYRGGAEALIKNFGAGHYVGVPLLHWYGMTIEPRQAKPGGAPAYPHMLRWLR